MENKDLWSFKMLMPSTMLRLVILFCLLTSVSVKQVQAAHLLEVRVGVYANEPKIFLSPAGEVSGIFGNLLQEIAKREGWQITPVPCEWQACLQALQAGQIDLMPDVARNEARAKIYDFHQTPALQSWSQVFRHKDVKIDAILDLKDKRIAILEGSVQQDYLTTLLQGFGLKAELVPVKTLPEGFAMAERRIVDAVIANRFFGELNAPRYQLTETPLMFQPSLLHFATGKNRNPDLLRTIDRHLDQWVNDQSSVYYAVLERWMGEKSARAIPPEVWWGIAGLAALLLLALGNALLLRRQVAEKTRHLQASENKLATILGSVDACIYIKDMDLRYQYANRRMCELFGRAPSEIIGRDDLEFFDAETAKTLRNNDRMVIESGERFSEEEHNRSRDGQTIRTYLSIKLPLRHADGQIYALCGISTDITERKKAEEAIHHLAFYDPLTNLPNRRLLFERLQQALASSARSGLDGALLFVDLDNFKELNDTRGHETGDQLLTQIAQRLGDCIRENDTVARLGGDEFVLMLVGLSPSRPEALQQAEVVARKVQSVLEKPYSFNDFFYTSTASIGVAMFSEPGNSCQEIIKRADIAMYRAKAAGRNAVRFFSPEMENSEKSDREQ